MKEEFFMNRRKVILTIVAIGLIALAFSFLNPEPEVVESPINIEIGQIFTGIEYPKEMYILNYRLADLNGDSVNDVVILLGEKESADVVKTTNVDIVLYDGALQKYTNANLKKLDGSSARLELADLTGDSLQDIVILLDTEDGDKMIRIVTLEQQKLKEIWKAKDNQFIRFTGEFVDGFKVNLANRKLNINKELDLKNASNSWVENGVFEQSGKCVINDNFKIKTTGFVELEFVQLTGSMGLKTKQRIITADYKNIIEEINLIWKYEEGKWQIKEAIGVKLGNLLY